MSTVYMLYINPISQYLSDEENAMKSHGRQFMSDDIK